MMNHASRNGRKAKAQPEGNGIPVNGAIALCLSGGGLRATLFHLGVVRALRAGGAGAAGRLAYVSEIYAVSGGSILAVHMLLNWERYTGNDEEFARVEGEIVRFAGRNMRDRILRRWILFRPIGLIAELLSKLPTLGRVLGGWDGLFSRTWWLQHEYETLARGLCFSALDPGQTAPLTHFLTTSFTTGELCSFSGDRFEIEEREAEDGSEPATTPCGHLRLSLAVAASSAFPPMFPPITVTDDFLANPISEAFSKRLCLSDGGVFDNLGIEKFLKTSRRNAAHPATLIISDAGGSFRASSEKTFSGIFARNIRASDILMHRVGDDAKDTISALEGVNDFTIRISRTFPGGSLEEPIQQRLRMVRTDLDRFDAELAVMLIDHGERVARHVLGIAPGKAKDATPVEESGKVERLNRLAQKAASRSFRSLVLDFRDWTLYPLLLIGTGLLAGTGYYCYLSWTAIEARKQAEGARLQAAENNAMRLRARSAEQERKIERASAALVAKDYAGLERILREDLATVSGQIRSDAAEVRTAAAAAGQAPVATFTQVPPATPVLHPQKVYIQFAGLLKRETIADLNAALRMQGWRIQGSSGERLARADGLSEVRYWGNNETDAIALRDAINALGLAPRPVDVKNMGARGSANLEIWVSR